MFGYKISMYEMVSAEKDLDYPNLGSFKVLIYGAYNAYGLIGSEQNGIAILDNDRMTVVCDMICPQDTGYLGPSEAQRQEFYRICQMSCSEFIELVNNHPRSRFELASNPE